jgi:hypothetical protein
MKKGQKHTEESKQKNKEKHLGRVHSEQTKIKMSNTRKVNPSRGMLGKHQNREVRERISHSMIRICSDPDVRMQRSRRVTGSLNPFFGKTHTSETKNKIREKRIGKVSNHKGKIHTDYSLGIYAGAKNPFFGHKCNSGKRVFYKNTFFRSSWEAIVAQWLDKKGVTWIYEPQRFYFENLSYLPDFYLPQQDVWLEVKGWINRNPRDKERMDLFIKNQKLLIIDKITINKISKILKNTFFDSMLELEMIKQYEVDYNG